MVVRGEWGYIDTNLTFHPQKDYFEGLLDVIELS